jgi:hypothetical protein
MSVERQFDHCLLLSRSLGVEKEDMIDRGHVILSGHFCATESTPFSYLENYIQLRRFGLFRPNEDWLGEKCLNRKPHVTHRIYFDLETVTGSKMGLNGPLSG